MNIRNQIIIDTLIDESVLITTCPIYDKNGIYSRTGISIKNLNDNNNEFIFELTDLFDIAHFNPTYSDLKDNSIEIKIKIKGNSDTFIKRIIDSKGDIIDIYNDYYIISDIPNKVIKDTIDCLFDIDNSTDKIIRDIRQKYNS